MSADSDPAADRIPAPDRMPGADLIAAADSGPSADRSDIDPQAADAIARLPLWLQAVRIEPLSGGITNRNYLVEDGTRRFVVRLCEERRLLGIDRLNERLCQEAAARQQIAPEVVHHEPGVLVSHHVAGATLTPEAVRAPARLERIAATLARLHEGFDALEGELLYFSPFQAVRTYASTARRLGAPLSAEIDEQVAAASDWSRRLAPFVPTLCHNDLLAANLIDDENRVWLVDWEYAGMGHPLFDLAGLAGNCGLDEDEERALLERYFAAAGRPQPAAAWEELQVLKTASLLREALWAAIQQVASNLAFDYAQYAADNLAAYRTARAQLESGVLARLER